MGIVEGDKVTSAGELDAERITDASIADLLENLGSNPLGIEEGREFRQ